MSEDFSRHSLFSLDGKHALVTGGSGGLGMMMSKGLLQNGATVTISSRNQEKCDKALAELQQYGECEGICAACRSCSLFYSQVVLVSFRSRSVSI